MHIGKAWGWVFLYMLSVVACIAGFALHALVEWVR
jgi:hypothetical protein